MPTGNKEDRRHKRIDLSLLRVNGTLAVVHDGYVSGCLVPMKDFSKSGAGVWVKFSLEEHTPVRLSIEGTNFLPIDGKVVWCGPSSADPQAPPSHPYRIGIDFMPKDDVDRENQLNVYNHVAAMAANVGVKEE